MQKETQDKNKAFAPKAIFAIDPPLDYVALYNSCLIDINRTCSNPSAKISSDESMWVKKYLENKFGDPIKDIENYEKQSSYSMRETDGGNAKYLIEMPLRIYHEMDPMWYIKERCKTISDSHLVVTTSLVNYLYQNRNKNAEIIISLNRGKRADGRRHPHSWSIVDEKDCLQWLLHFLE